MAQPISDLKSYLSGPWAFLRCLNDQRLSQRGSIVGRAAFDPDDEGLHYREQGRLWFGGDQGEALRSYRYRFAAPGRAEVAFEDGRPFHELCLAAGSCTVEHLCGADHYSGTFEALGPHALRVNWRVEGPRKDYRLETDYLRFAGNACGASGEVITPIQYGLRGPAPGRP